jgi:hypothetical protein
MIDQTAEALTDLGNMAMQQRNDALARRLYEEGLAIWRALDYKPGIVHLRERLESLTRKQDQGATGSGVFTYTVNAEGTGYLTTYVGFVSAPKP